MVASTLMASVLTGSGVLASSVVTQVFASRSATKQAAREKEMRQEQRDDATAREDRERRERLLADRRSNSRPAYETLATDLNSLQDALWAVQHATLFDLYREDPNTRTWQDSYNRAQELLIHARKSATLQVSEKVRQGLYTLARFLPDVAPGGESQHVHYFVHEEPDGSFMERHSPRDDENLWRLRTAETCENLILVIASIIEQVRFELNYTDQPAHIPSITGIRN